MKKLFTAICITAALSATAQVGIGTNTPDASAQFEIVSPDKGLLIPRMTAAIRTGIASPATGLLVYQTDGAAGFYYNGGTAVAPNWALLQTSTNVTTQGNTFNGAGQLVQLNGSSQLPAASGVNVTNLNADNISSGTVATARLGSGTANSTTVLKGDGTWGAVSAAFPAVVNAATAFSGSVINATSYSDVQTVTVPSTGKYLVTAVGYVSANTNEALMIQVTQNGTVLAESTGYADVIALCNLSHVINLTTTTSIKFRARMPSWSGSPTTNFSGNFSLVKLSN